MLQTRSANDNVHADPADSSLHRRGDPDAGAVAVRTDSIAHALAGRQKMTSAFILAASAGGAVALVNLNEIIKDPSTKGWVVGIGSLSFIVFGFWAIVR